MLYNLCIILFCPALPCPALPCPALQLIWQAVWTFVIPYILASVIKGLLDRFGRVQMSVARLITGAREILPYTSAWFFIVSGVFNGAKKSVFDKRKNRKTWLSPICIYSSKQFFQAFKCGHRLILVDSFCRKRLKGMSLGLAGF